MQVQEAEVDKTLIKQVEHKYRNEFKMSLKVKSRSTVTRDRRVPTLPIVQGRMVDRDEKTTDWQ